MKHMIEKTAKKILAGFTGLLLFAATAMPVQAAENLTVLERYTTENGVVLYVKGLEGSVDAASYQVGTTECALESISTVEESAESIRTLILWDNSLSVMNKCESTVKSILIDLVANRAAGEEFAIAAIDEEITYLTDYTGDYTALKKVIEGVTGENKDAYIIENLYEAILSLNQMDDCGYKRIIVISDGMDATEIGYSREELNTLLSQTPYPIYSIGIASKDSSEELQNMFALSRTTGVDYFYLDEIEDTLSVVQALSADYGLLQVKATIPVEIQDGSTQNSQLILTSGATTYTGTSQVVLPFLSKTSETEDGSEQDVISDDVETMVETEGDELEDTDAKEGKMILLFGRELPLLLVIGIAVGAVALLVAIILIIVFCTRKKPQPEDNHYQALDQKIRNERNAQAAETPGNVGVQGASAPNGAAAVPGVAGASPAGGLNATGAYSGGKTQSLFDGASDTGAQVSYGAPAGSHRVTLTNVMDSIKTYQCSMADKILVGRNPAKCNLAIPTDNAVSETHCEIGITGGKFYILDLNSSNGTFVNGYRISAMTEIKSDCILKLGRQDYRITLE